MHKISSYLWFDNQAEEAARFYTSLFKNAKIGTITRYSKAGFEIHKQPEGRVMTIDFELDGQSFVGLNGGPVFTFNPSISFLINCSTKEEVETLYKQLSAGGSDLMALGEYPFSQKYAWVKDRYGLSWQIMFTKEAFTQKIIPTFMFVGDQCGNAEPAMNFYTSIFKNSSIEHIMRYPKTDGPDKEGTVLHAAFTLDGQQFAAMDSAQQHDFSFNEAISFTVMCKSQEEVDYYWNSLSEGGDPNAQQCGWLKDKFGVSWQIVPTVLVEMLQNSDIQKVERLTNAFMQMKKLDIDELEKVFK